MLLVNHLIPVSPPGYLPDLAAQLRRLGADTDASLTGWLDEQPMSRFKITWKTAS
jgi:hypothetical protein